MLAVVVANIQTGVLERRDDFRCELRRWGVSDFDDLISCDVHAPLSLIVLETSGPVTIPTARAALKERNVCVL